MKTVTTTFGHSYSGTEMIKVTRTSRLGQINESFIFLNEKRQIISIEKSYGSFSPVNYSFNLCGLNDKVLTQQITEYFSIDFDLQLAMYIQERESAWMGASGKYSYPLYRVIEKLKDENYKNLAVAERSLAWEKKQNNNLANEISELKQIISEISGKTASAAIKTALKNREIAAKKHAAAAKKMKIEKIKSNKKLLKSKLKEGYNFIAELRNYSNKGRTFNGTSLEFRKEKPTTKNYYSITKESIERLAETLTF